MISDLNGSLGSRQFLEVANERTCFASCACSFKSTGLFTRLESTSYYKVIIIIYNLLISSAQVSTIRFSNARYKSKMCTSYLCFCRV